MLSQRNSDKMFEIGRLNMLRIGQCSKGIESFDRLKKWFCLATGFTAFARKPLYLDSIASQNAPASGHPDHLPSLLVNLLNDRKQTTLLELSIAVLHISAENFCFAASSSGNNFSKMAGMSIRLVATDKLMAAIVCS